jgi:hypothetical protein
MEGEEKYRVEVSKRLDLWNIWTLRWKLISFCFCFIMEISAWETIRENIKISAKGVHVIMK